jgi:transcription initiation factor TFIIIB Brf1 subunit/transcription initiation factor TFIIB
MPYCPECGGKLNWDRRFRHYICQSCGLTFTDQELSEARDKLYRAEEEDEKSRRQREYLEWWFKEKKDKR